MSNLKKIGNKLFKQTTELKSHEVELARKAPSILNDLNKLNNKLIKSESKISSEFLSYKKAWQNFQDTIKDVEAERKRLEGDIAEINQAAMDLGVDFDSVKGLKEAQDMSRRLDGLVSDFPKLYNRPK